METRKIELAALEAISELGLPLAVFSVHRDQLYAGVWCIKFSTPDEVMAFELLVKLDSAEIVKEDVKRQLRRKYTKN